MLNVIADIERRLVPMLIAGEEEAFTLLYDNYSAMLFGVISRVVDDYQEAQNLLQDCFIKIWKNIESFDEEKGRLATWMINIARHTAIDFTRSKHFSQKRKNQNLDNLVFPVAERISVRHVEDTVGLRQLVEKLPGSCREVIEWMYFEGYTQQEISENFNIPLGTVKTRARIALMELKNAFS
ncbi:MAG: sigma-70 family RNA polymerase sigma factor [Saprospiraceae bacterium]|nr:sigma-70 family RNA polymerase sigma factor [Saprospiraceae bacterium]